MKNNNKRAFLLRLDHRMKCSLENNIIGIGWAYAEKLDQVSEWKSFKDIIRNAYPEIYENKERALGNAAGSAWRFTQEMQIDDLVIIPEDKGFYVCKILSKPFYEINGKNNDYTWRRKVEWLTEKPIPRNYVNGMMQRRMKARQTCVDCSDLVCEIEASLQRKKPITIVDSIFARVKDNITEALIVDITDRDLEELIKALSMSSGATSVIPPKNNKAPGDVDVLATYDLKVGNQESVIHVAYQVKQHQGMDDETGIRQLIDRMDYDNSIALGCYVTTADKISEKASELAKNNNIIVLIKSELIEWILDLSRFEGRTV